MKSNFTPFAWLLNHKVQRIVLICVIIFLGIKTQHLDFSTNDLTSRQNNAALKDSIRSYYSDDSALVYEKLAFITDESTSLKSLNSELEKEIKHLRDNPIIVIKTKTVIVHDTVKIPIHITRPGIWTNGTFTQEFSWSFDKDYENGNYRKLGGKFNTTVDSNYILSAPLLDLTQDEFGISFTTGFTENSSGLLEIFIKSDYPNFKPASLDGALIDPKNSEVLQKYFPPTPPKKWSLGLNTGYGLYCDLQKNTVGLGLQIGIGVQYNLIQWNFKK